MRYNIVQEYGEVHNSQPGIDALPPQLRLKGRQAAQRSNEGRAAALVCLELGNKILALHGSVLALLHDAHGLRSIDILSVDWVASLSTRKQSLTPDFSSHFWIETHRDHKLSKCATSVCCSHASWIQEES